MHYIGRSNVYPVKKESQTRYKAYMLYLTLILSYISTSSYKYFALIHQIKLYINIPQAHLNQSITFEGGRFSDIGILLMAKKGVAQKSPPPPQRVELKTCFGDTRDLILELGEYIYLPFRSSRFAHILSKNATC